MNHYNVRLKELRKQRGLSIKEAAKKIGILPFVLSLYENGYFRPGKKATKKIESFYGAPIPLEGISAYPIPSREERPPRKKLSKTKHIVFGSLLIASIAFIALGASLFSGSIKNDGSFYGETYSQMREKVNEKGAVGYDLITGLKYHYVEYVDWAERALMSFYETDNILYFNEATFTVSLITEEYGHARFHYAIGSNLGVNSYRCTFTYSGFSKDMFFSCDFAFAGAETITNIDKLTILAPGEIEVNNETALLLVNKSIGDVNALFDRLLTESLGKETSFYRDFLPDREKGRSTNFNLQITGIIFLLVGIVATFAFLEIVVKDIVRHIKPRLIKATFKNGDGPEMALPEDITNHIGIPDTITMIIAKVCQFGALFITLLSLLGSMLPLPPVLSDSLFLEIVKKVWLGGIILGHIVTLGRVRKANVLFGAVVHNLFLFLLVATLETVAISITTAWGYNIANLIYSYIPGNVFQIVAVHYLIFLFLFFQPSFLEKKGRFARVLWHSLSVIPLGFLVASYVISNSYLLIYGVKENIFVNFWFPNGIVVLSLVVVIYMYALFFLRLGIEKRFGLYKAQIYFYGDRYNLIENMICSAAIIVIAVIDIGFAGNQYAFYLGLGFNLWILALIPFVMLNKNTPNNLEIINLDYLADDLIDVI